MSASRKPSSEQIWGIVDKIGTKIAITNDKAVLQESLSTQLPQLLSLLSFPDTNVRNKVVEVLTHINKRVKAESDDIRLPFRKILDLYLNPPSNSPFVKNFAMIYLEMAHQRSTPEEKADVLTVLLNGIATRNEPQLSTLLRFMLDGILYTRIPEKEEDIVEKFNVFRVQNEDLTVFLNFLKDVLLLKPNYRLTGEVLNIPEGLSIPSVKRIVGEKGMDSKQLLERKEAIANFITSNILPDNAALPLLIIGSVDGQEPMTSKCENRLKKLAEIDLEDQTLIETLFELYLGKKYGRTRQSADVKVKIIYYLTKSVLAANSGELTRDVLFDALFNEYSLPKLKASGMQFFMWILNEGKRESTETFAKSIFIHLIDALSRLSSSNPSNVGELSQINIMKENFYTALGSMAKKFPEFVRDKFYIVQLYFTGLIKEEPRIKIAIQQGLSSLIDAYKNPDAQLQANFERMFSNVVLEPNRNSHAVAAVLRCANRLFPFEHIPSRFVNLLCADDQNLNVREESYRGSDLDRFSKYRQLDSKEIFHYPGFVEFTDYVYSYVTNPSVNAPSPGAHCALIEFMRKTLQASAKANNQTLESYVSTDLRSVKTKSGEYILDAYSLCLQKAFHEHSTADLLLEASSAVLHLASMDVEFFGPTFAGQFGFVRKYMFNGDEQSREKTARLMALLYIFMDESSKQQLLELLKDNMTDSTESNSHGAILTLGNIIALTYKRTRDPVVPDDLKGITEQIVDIIVIGSHRALIPRACYTAIGEIARQGALCYFGQYRKPLSAEQEKKLTRVVNSKSELLDLLLSQLKSETVSNSLKEKIITSLSMLCLHESDQAVLQTIIDALFNLSTDKAEEIQFTIGETFSCIAGGELYCSLYRSDEYENIFNRQLSEEARLTEEKLSERFTTAILTQIVRNGVLSPKKIVRQSSSIWLLAVSRYCSDSPYLRKYLKDIQKAFSVLLTDNNEVTNEVAGRGLAYVYELGDKSTQKELVESLMNSLAGKKNTKDIKLTQDSELLLFPEEVKGGMDKSMGTYKELVSVANDIGKPEMIYQMLAVSSHHAIWNAKKAAAFSAVSIASFTQSHEELEKVLPTIVPKLFRYQFDPNPIINRSMTDMWNSLVKNPKETIDKFFPAIIKEVIDGLNSDLWRVREASCYAVTDLLSGRRFRDMEPFLEETMLRVFRVTDDIKESGRKAAASTMKKLGSFTVKCCNPKYTMDRNDVKRALEILIPVYLKTGLLFPAKEVVSFSLEHIQKICQVSLQLIKPHITDVIGTLLEQMSVLEPAAFNYIQLNADKYNISQEQLESMRLSMVQSGPINDAIAACARFIDEEVCETLVPRVLDILRSGVGLPTRTATAKFIGDLGKFHGNAAKKLIPKILTVMMRTVQNTSSVVEKKVLAASLPYILKNAKVSQGKAVIQQILDMYIATSDENKSEDTHYASGVLMENIAKHVPVIIKKFNELVLPVVFIARHDDSKRVSAVWESVWEETMTTSPKDTVRLYLEPIADMCIQLLNHQSWKMKRQGGQGLSEIGSLVNIDIAKTQRVKIINNLLGNVPGRVWDGKEVLLDALASNCEAYRKDPDFENEEERILLQKVLDVALKECSRNNTTFKLQALICLKKILKVPLFESMIDNNFYTTARSLINETQENIAAEENKMTDVDAENNQKNDLTKKKEQKQFEDILCQTWELIPLIIPPHNSELFDKEKHFVLEKLQSARLSVTESFSLLSSLMSLTTKLLANLDIQERVFAPEHAKQFISVLLQQTDPSQRQILTRTRAFETMAEFLKLLKEKNTTLLHSIQSFTTDLLADAKSKEKDTITQVKFTSLLRLFE